MPCGHKWKNKTMRRIPVGMGSAHGVPIGFHYYGESPYVRYRPGCQPVQHPGISLNYARMQSGYYVPNTIRGAVPLSEPCCPAQGPCPPREHHAPWTCGQDCSYQYATGHECPRPDGGLNEVDLLGMGQSSAAPSPPRAPRRTRPPGVFPGDGSAGGCNPFLGGNYNQVGCANETRPSGLYWGFQRGWRGGRRKTPYPVGQQPYWVGKNAAHYGEPYAGCPTRSTPYLIPDGPAGIGKKRGLTLRGRRR